MSPVKKNVRKTEEPNIVDLIHLLCKEKQLDEELLIAAIEDGIRMAYKKNLNLPKGVAAPNNLKAVMDRHTGLTRVYSQKIVMLDDDIEDDETQISVEDAQAINPNSRIGDICEVDVTPEGGFLRVAAMQAKQIITQRIREAEQGKIYDEYSNKEDEILTGIVERMENKTAYLDLGHTEGVLEAGDMIPGEELVEGDHVKVYVLEVRRAGPVGPRGPQVRVSRVHPNLVKRLFEMEVPEIASGIVKIENITREAGSRTKMAVSSADIMTDPVGACVGQRGGRVERVVTELKGEKIDIIKYSKNPAEFVANALNPARVTAVYTKNDEKSCLVVVPDNQLSLAIGKEGQNARLAARLTGWKIDIKSQSQAAEMPELAESEAAENVPADETPTFEDFLTGLPDLDVPSVESDDDTL